MPLTGQAKKEWQQENYLRLKEQRQSVEALKEKDVDGKRYKSEVLSWYELGQLFYGIKPSEAEAEPEEGAPKKRGPKPKEKKNVIRPATDRIFGKSVSFEEWLELRDKARKDLFWLGRDVLRRDLLEHVHGPVCRQFLQKNFDGAFREGYTLKDVHDAINRQERFDEHGEPTKEMMLLDPRGFYKSTIDGIDCVQWLLNVPDVRILILTGEYKLALSFMKEIKDYFFLPEGAHLTDFHLLFPEYILKGVDGTSKEPIDCPARRHRQRFPSLWVNSIDANLSGWHCDVRKTDDVVTDTNCNNEKTRQELKEKIDGTDNLLDEWGFSDYIGTRYWVDDYYGMRLKPDEETGEVAPLKYFCRQAWTVKPEHTDVPLKKLTSDMVTLAFREKATFASLRKKLLKNERSFRNQQLNEPTEVGEDSAYKVTFLEEVMRAHFITNLAVPRDGDIFITWDWAPSSNKYSDMSVGVAAQIYKKFAVGRDENVTQDVWAICVREIRYGRWKPSDLAFNIVDFNKKWSPKQTLIEKSNGAELLQLEVQRQAQKYGVVLNTYWRPLDMQDNAKRNRVKGLETLLNDDRLYFVQGPWIDETLRQFTNYTGEKKNRGRKDDIPDAVSFQSFFLPSTQANDDKKEMEEIARKAAMLRAGYERIFGSAPIPTTPQQPEEPPRPINPLMKFFGGNGLRV